MIEGLRWVQCNKKDGKRRHNLVYFKNNKRLLTGFVQRTKKGLPWVAVFVHGKYNLTIKRGIHESCRLWVQRVAEYHILNSQIDQLEEPKMEKVVETIFMGREITVYNENNIGTIPSYTICDNGVTVQYELTAEEVMGWMANTMMNASTKK